MFQTLICYGAKWQRKELLDQAGPQNTRPTGAELELGLAWVGSLKCPHLLGARAPTN